MPQAYYIIYRIDTGEFRTYTTNIPYPLPDGLAVTAVDHKPNWDVEQWDTVTRTLVAKVFDRQTIEREFINPAYTSWYRWYITRLEAVRRSIPAAAITALTNKEDEAWSNYLAILNQWRNAL